jgi:hypothetical protein
MGALSLFGSAPGLRSLLLCGSVTLASSVMAQNPAPPAQSSNQSQSNQSAQPASDSDNSLATAARDAKAQKANHAKKVFTDDDMEAMSGPLPRLKLQGSDNADEIIAAIKKYRAIHTPEETEQTIHGWYDRYDQMLTAAYDENAQMMSLRNINASNGFDLCQESQDPRQCQAQRNDMHGMRTDSTEMMKNNDLEMRLQAALLKIRTELMQERLHFDWFKVKTSNGTEL